MPINLDRVRRRIIVRLVKSISVEDSVEVIFSREPDQEVLKDLESCEYQVRGKLKDMNGLKNNCYKIHISSAFESEDIAKEVVRCLKEDHNLSIICELKPMPSEDPKEVKEF